METQIRRNFPKRHHRNRIQIIQLRIRKLLRFLSRFPQIKR